MKTVAEKKDELVGLEYLMDILSCGRTTVWRRMRDGIVPAPLRLGSTKPRWKKSTLDNWLAGLGG